MRLPSVELSCLGIFSFLLVLCLYGCDQQAAVKNPEGALRDRATAYWNARKLNDILTFYQMEDGSLEGGDLKPEDMSKYLEARGKLVGYEFKHMEVNGDKATIQVVQKCEYPWTRGAPINLSIADQWVLIKGVWYHKQPAGGFVP